MKHVLLTHSRQVADRALAIVARHPEWVEQARGEGLKLSCCVVSDPENIIKSNNLNADILVTNTPVLAQRIYLHYKRNQ